MKRGELVCLGDAQHLRNVHGVGYLLEIVLEKPSMLQEAIKFVTDNFFGALLIDERKKNEEIYKLIPSDNLW